MNRKNRKIKFRAWDKSYKRMNYKVQVGNTDYADQNYTCNSIWVDYADTKNIGWMSADDKCIELMQFTGLKDKNGKDIYEGDVIKGGVRTMKVIYNQSFCQYWLVWENKEKRLCFEPLKSSYKSNNFTDDGLEIIGNIYENKEYEYLLTL